MSEDARLEELTYDECLEHLRGCRVGRLAVVHDGFPHVLPVNYRLVEASNRVWIAVRTRPGNVIERATVHVAFEIDEIDPGRHRGWSVLARGTLHHVDINAASFHDRFDPEPWILEERDAWLAIDPFAITGRRLHPADQEWAFDAVGYL